MCSRTVSSQSLFGTSTLGLSCGTSTLVRKPIIAVAAITTVDDLQVRGQLLTNTQIGGSLELLGTQSRDPLEVALYVRKSALVDGLAQHGALRVLGDSELLGSLRVPLVHGPVSIDSTEDPVVGPALSITNGMVVDEMSAGFQITSVLEAGVATIAGYNAGALAVPELLTLLAPRIVSVVSAGGTYTTLGYAYDSTRVLTTYNWVVADDGAAANVTTVGATPTVVIANTLGTGGTAVASTSLGVCPAGNMSVVQSTPAAVFPATPTEGLSALIAGYEDDSDSPPVGMQVFVVFGSILGGLQYGLGVVTDSSAQMFAEYTSIHVTLTGSTGAPLALGSAGGLIFDMRGRLLGMLQYGITGSSTLPVYTNTIGGIKGRYIRYFLDNLAATVSLPTGISTPFRAITIAERAAGVGSLSTGGVANADVGMLVDPSTQTLVVSTLSTAPLVAGVRLGSTAPNAPSFTDTVIATGTVASETFQVLNADAPTAITVLVGDAFLGTAAAGLWTNGLPTSFATGSTVFTGATSSIYGLNNDPEGSNTPTYWALNYVLTDLASTQSTDWFHISHGLFGSSLQTPKPLQGLFMTFTFGGVAGVSTFLSTHADPIIQAAWAAAQPPLGSGSLLFVVGVMSQENTFIMQALAVPMPTGPTNAYTMQLKITSPGGVSAGVAMAGLNFPTGVYGTTFMKKSVFNALSVQKSCASASKPSIGPSVILPPTPPPLGQSAISYLDASTTAVTTSLTTAFATPLY
jgi:hypothetical protein